MGLDEPDLDLSDLVNSNDDNNSDSGTDVDLSNMTKKEAAEEVIKRGQITLGNNEALIKCPCDDPDEPLDTVYMCALSMRPDPEDGKQKPVCSGPIEGWNLMGGDFHTWRGGKGVLPDCPYSPDRF
ncbi:hypothetical protein SAMN05443574_103312 [Haloarcula vallismortis]|uniref:Uncharacterized protein n=2 Tax=Haloarcula vallismortis TaxID=28442 RepID=M0JVB1_HALVA|nr:hypothetical protein [Haloarcula vallismortis]EMA11575.1 hypothetical protein C437_01645 [Haloarcula vallismortis ATCC 29715]SDW45302.1 hypothetical protein SAMN05443574_103312 [Haloarcula vallismortis]